MKRVLLQFCSSKDTKEFEKDHYVRKMTAEGRTDKSKPIGEVRGHHGQQIHYLIWYNTLAGRDWASRFMLPDDPKPIQKAQKAL